MAYNLIKESLTQPHLAFPQSRLIGAFGFHQKSVSSATRADAEVSRPAAV